MSDIVKSVEALRQVDDLKALLRRRKEKLLYKWMVDGGVRTVDYRQQPGQPEELLITFANGIELSLRPANWGTGFVGNFAEHDPAVKIFEQELAELKKKHHL